jgi:hypothetical protein
VSEESRLGARSGIVDLGVLQEALVEDGPRCFPLSGLEQLYDTSPCGEVDNRPVCERVVKFPQLEQDPIDSPNIGQVRFGVTEEIDGMVVSSARTKRPPQSLVLVGLAQTNASTARAAPA